MHTLTLSIVSHGHGPLLAHLLDDLSRLKPQSPCQVIVTLNLADEAFDPAAWPALDILILRNEAPRGFGANHNAAFAHCRSNWFVVLNPDLRLPVDPFALLVERACLDPRLGVVAPRIVNSLGKAEDSLRANLTPWSLFRRAFDRTAGRAEKVLSPGRHDGFFWLAGMFLVFPSEAYRRIGGFDERFFLYCEDYDICARLRYHGYRLAMDHRVIAVHDAQRDSRRSRRHLRWHLSSLFKVWMSAAFWRATFNVRKPGLLDGSGR